MTFVLAFLLGLIVAVIGLIPPSMLNMTTVKISATKGKIKAKHFAIGASVTVFFQALLALLITKILKENQYLLVYLKEIAAIIFLGLSVYFFKKGFSDSKEDYSSKQKIKNNFITGIILSFLNMFAIPYYCGVGSVLDIAGFIKLDNISILSFVVGATIGTFIILYLYSYAAQKMLHKIEHITNNINFILGGITGIVGLLTLINLL